MSLGWQLVTEPDAENPVVGDLRIAGGRLARLPDRLAQIAQACQVELGWWSAEWSFDLSRGQPYLEVLGQSGVSAATLRALVVRALRRVNGVRAVAAATVTIDSTTGHAQVSDVVVTTDAGERLDVPGIFGARAR